MGACDGSSGVRAPRKARPIHVSHERLLELLHYDPESGVFTWLVSTGLNNQKGRVAGGINRHSKLPYRVIGFDGQFHLSARVAWFYMTGNDAEHEVDHENKDTLDDRWLNLRLATHSQNMMNRSVHRNNKSGFKGVGRSKQKWNARITVDKETLYLGYFQTPEDAARAYDAAARIHHGEFARLNFPAEAA